MNSTDLERVATEKARKFDPSILPFPTSANLWRTWVSNDGGWLFIEKDTIENVANALGMEEEVAFNSIGQRMLEWLKDNSSQVRPKTIWKMQFGPAIVNFGVFANQCFVFNPRGRK